MTSKTASPIERHYRRLLETLRAVIGRSGFTQLEIQRELSWGPSYISQLLNHQKELHVDQVFKILQVIGVAPVDFFAEALPPGGAVTAPAPTPQGEARLLLAELHTVVDLLEKNGHLTRAELEAAVEAARGEGEAAGRLRIARRRPPDRD